ncbi:hypothetical protein EVAR_78891_1 [Eumeta japonica]|uniref:Uncharacterized protein n=1 Tax=Eumeta variegata TaxID=151549 RepID=A0A4C1U383_EUMVA|nr:hypothetical protein EVAR_78891_1 [Eumeta japonica]
MDSHILDEAQQRKRLRHRILEISTTGLPPVQINRPILTVGVRKWPSGAAFMNTEDNGVSRHMARCKAARVLAAVGFGANDFIRPKKTTTATGHLTLQYFDNVTNKRGAYRIFHSYAY